MEKKISFSNFLNILSDERVKYFVLFVSFFIEVFNYSVGKQAYLWIPIVANVWNILLIFYVILTGKIESKNYNFFIVAAILIGVSQSLTVDFDFVTVLALIILCKNLNPEKIILTSIVAILSASLINIGLYQTGFLADWGNAVDEVHYSSYGFTHRTIFPILLTTVSLGIIYLDYNCKHFILNSLIMIIFLYVSMVIFHTRTTGILISFILIFYLFNKIRTFKLFNWINYIFEFVVKHIWIWVGFAALFTVLTTVLFSLDIPILNKLNEFFTGRIYLQNNAFKFFGFPLVSVGYMGSKYSLFGPMILDNSFSWGIYTRGLIFVIAFVGYFVYLSHKAYKKGDERYNVIVIFKLIEALSVMFIYNFLFTPFILLALHSKEDCIND